jgi:regulator of sigma E protease
MIELIQTIIATVVTLGVLVSIHEFGHFWVARRCGVRVLRFSVGFGKPLWLWYGKDGTEYAIAMIPLGGYVKMLDEREGEVPETLRQEAFNNKPVLQRIAIVLAGPLANFFLAVLAFWLMYVVGVRGVVPVIGEVLPESVAHKAGLPVGAEVVQVDGVTTPDWNSISMVLLEHIGNDSTIRFGLRQHPVSGEATETVTEYPVVVSQWLAGAADQNPIAGLGLVPWRPLVPAEIGSLLEGGRAALAGLQVDDRILTVNGEPVTEWFGWVDQVRASPEEPLMLEVQRDTSVLNLELVPARKLLESGEPIGFIGAGAKTIDWPDSLHRVVQYSPLEAVLPAVHKTWSVSVLTLSSIGKMIAGALSVENLSGPITIAKVAGDSARSGVESFLYFLAILSVSLGVLNLLPIPVLDGGHLLFYCIEWVKGSPIPEKIQVIGTQLGLGLVLAIMMLALYNDFSRL